MIYGGDNYSDAGGKAELADEWKAMLGAEWKEIQQSWLHRLGNLTLSGFNPELQAAPFLHKRDLKPGGYADSSVWLNRGLAKLDRWTPVEMESRGQQLAKVALSVWPPLVADSLAVKQAELEDAVQAASGKTRADVKCEEPLRPWLDKLADFALSLGEDVTEVPGQRSLVFRMPSWFVELLPRANWIDMRLACDAAELASVAAGVQASSMWAWIANSAIPGTEGAIYSVNSEAKLEVAYALIRKAYELAEDDS